MMAGRRLPTNTETPAACSGRGGICVFREPRIDRLPAHMEHLICADLADRPQGLRRAVVRGDLPLEPCDIVPCAVLPSRVVEPRRHMEAQRPVQRLARGIRAGDNAVDGFYALPPQQLHQCLVEQPAESVPGIRLCDVDRKLRVPAVGRARLCAVRVGIGRWDAAVKQRQIGILRRDVRDARGKFGLARERVFKGDRGVDALVVDAEQRSCVGRNGKTKLHNGSSFYRGTIISIARL